MGRLRTHKPFQPPRLPINDIGHLGFWPFLSLFSRFRYGTITARMRPCPPELTPILIAVATVGVALAALMIGLFTWLRQDMGGRIDRLESRTNQRFYRLESQTNERFRVDERFDRPETRLAAVEHGQAKLEGLLEGLREAISGRRAAS